MTKFANRGKRTESEIEGWLDQRSDADIGFAWHPYPDARSARGALAKQPADYLVARKGHGVAHLEAKETTATRSLAKSKIGQYGMLKKFDLAGMRTVVVVYASALDRWTYLTASDLFDHDVPPSSFKLCNPMHESVDGVMTELFGPIRKVSD